MIALAAIAADVRIAVRTLAKRPMVLAGAVASIAIGAGLNISVYSVLRRLMFDSIVTATAPERLVRVGPGISFPNYLDLRAADLPIELAAMQMTEVTWRTPGGARVLSAHAVSDNFFDVVGVRPTLGRTFGAGGGDATDVAVVTHGLWQQLGGDSAVVGRSVDLNGRPYVIAGVLPRGFTAVAIVSGAVYVPISRHVTTALDNRRAAQFDLFGRLADGVTREQALAALRVVAARLEADAPDVNSGFARGLTASAMDAFSFLRQVPAGQITLAAAATLYGLVGLVLLVACANVAGLLVARADERRHDIAVRVALGATSARLTQQFLTESLVISSLGCAAGAAIWMMSVAWLSTRMVTPTGAQISVLPASVPFGYSLLLVCAVTIASGVAPAMAASRMPVRSGLESRRRGALLRGVTLQRALVAAQIAICFVLLTAAAVLLRNLLRLQFADAGFDVAHIVRVDMRFPTASQPASVASIRSAVWALPGVQAVSWGSPVGPPVSERIQPADTRDGARVAVDVRLVGPRFFETMRIPLARGRDLKDDDLDARSPKPVVVNETFARRYLGEADAIGRRFVRPRSAESGRQSELLEIVGVAADTLARTVGDSRVPVVYVPQRLPSLTVRVAAPAASAVRTLQQSVERLGPPGTVVTAASMADRLAGALLPIRIAGVLLSVLGAVGIVLATTGLVAVVSHAASRRRFEVGVRIALGATRAAIVAMFVRDGLYVVAAGCLIGGLLSLGLARVLQALVTQQWLLDPAAFVGVILFLIVVGVGASLRPAVRAGRADPVVALRAE